MINFLNLEYFLVAAEELNFTKAAKKLFISQQSLSNHISNMEKEFDVILFNRTTPLTLTYAGQALKAKADKCWSCGTRPTASFPISRTSLWVSSPWGFSPHQRSRHPARKSCRSLRSAFRIST